MRLDRHHELFRTSVRAVLERLFLPELEDWEKAGEMPTHELYRSLGEEGLLGLTLPVDDGGLGLDLGYSHVWARELGRLPAGSPAMSLSVQTDIVLPLLAEEGGTGVRDAYLRSAVRGELVAALAATEPGGGSDLAAVRTTAVRDADGLRLNGDKAFLTNGSVADFAVVLCHLLPSGADEGGNPPDGLDSLTLVLVPTGLPGVRQERHTGKLGNRACDHGRLSFTDVRVPEENLLGKPGSGYEALTRVFTRERTFLAAVCTARAATMLDRATTYARGRAVLGRPLLQHQAIAFRLAELDAELALIEQYTDAVFQRLQEDAAALRQASIAKLRASRLERECADLLLQLHGGAGYLEGGPVERGYRDARAYALAGGADEALLHLIAGHPRTDV
ncbi:MULTISPECIES: acyl-CoA dehydrogenase family protein [Streptomyces]|uniref:2,3-diaminopropionate alpha,beta-desaturase n=1 Tax=Streptomyces vinaceus TaxID=1960 RepID=Q6WZA3_STRVI|nr:MULTISPECIES: acyl-CoA dehydrogenase family protein [Streptomyces]AAP92500.1 2,3-diaminopropionate alpha,beta-desaturase [Streptomyces vinaceus]MDP9953656.1 citronellyl-CoA dehydrogenase/2,3-diaminopropionyl alpha,beta-desaturase [Streptomyces sp. DSM 41269]